MEYTEVTPLPPVCQNCQEGDCYNCDYAGQRWQLSQEDELRIRKKGLLRAIERNYLTKQYQKNILYLSKIGEMDDETIDLSTHGDYAFGFFGGV